jgi:hypothetical protein
MRELIEGLSQVSRNFSKSSHFVRRRGSPTIFSFLAQVLMYLAFSPQRISDPESDEEPSNVILESRAAGLAMIVTGIGGNAEEVVDASILGTLCRHAIRK